MVGQLLTRWRLWSGSSLYRFRESLFLLPAGIVAAGIGLSLLTGWIDKSVPDGRRIPLTLEMSSNAATWLLSTVAGATITTAGVVFSLTVVSLQLASSQFSPRVMRSFIRDRLSQVVIGMLVSTFVYCVLVLPRLSGEPAAPAPPVSMTMATVLAVVTVVLIMAHLDHLAHRLQVGHVVRAIADEGEKVITSMSARKVRGLIVDPQPAPPPTDPVRIPCPSNGWVGQLDVGGMLSAIPKGTTVQLETRIGAYIHRGEALLTVWPEPSPSTVAALVETVDITDARTMQQDVDFALRQLVDIGLKALSAAINDPSTAVEVTLRLGSLMRQLLASPLAAPLIETPDHRRLIRPWDLDHQEYIAHAFDQLRQTAPSQPQVAAALLRVLRMLTVHVRDVGSPHLVPALERQATMLLDALAEADLHPQDLARLRELAAGRDPADHRTGTEPTPPSTRSGL